MAGQNPWSVNPDKSGNIQRIVNSPEQGVVKSVIRIVPDRDVEITVLIRARENARKCPRKMQAVRKDMADMASMRIMDSMMAAMGMAAMELTAAMEPAADTELTAATEPTADMEPTEAAELTVDRAADIREQTVNRNRWAGSAS